MHEGGPTPDRDGSPRGTMSPVGMQSGATVWRPLMVQVITTGEGQLRLQKILLDPPPPKQRKFIKEN